MFVVVRQRRSGFGSPRRLTVNNSDSPSRRLAAADGHSRSSHEAYCSNRNQRRHATFLSQYVFACQADGIIRLPATCTERIRDLRTNVDEIDADVDNISRARHAAFQQSLPSPTPCCRASGDQLMRRRTLNGWGSSPLEQIDRDNVCARSGRDLAWAEAASRPRRWPTAVCCTCRTRAT